MAPEFSFENVRRLALDFFERKICEFFLTALPWLALDFCDFKMLDNEVAQLIKDDDVTNKKGIYPYILTGDERYLSIRAFTDNQKIKAYERQLGICPICKQHFELAQMEADHITPWCEGGPTIDTNCQMLCRDCNRRKSDK